MTSRVARLRHEARARSGGSLYGVLGLLESLGRLWPGEPAPREKSECHRETAEEAAGLEAP